MNPTRPIDTKKPGITTVVRGVATPAGAAKVADVTAGAKAMPESAISVDLSLTSRVRADAHRIDAQRLQSLKQAVTDGTYEVDNEALAKRIVEDALGPEVAE